MTTVTTKAMAKVAAVATGLAMATSMLSFAPMVHAAALTSGQVDSIVGFLVQFGADAATIANVKASLTGGTPTSTTSGSTTTTTTCSFGTKDLTMGATGAAVTALQQALINGGYSIPAGATGYFGAQTRSAVIAWQKANGVTPAVGYFGSISRSKFNLSCSSSSTTTTTTTTTTTAGTGTGLKVSLSPTSPNGTVLVQGQGIGDLGDFVFANPTATPINVTGLTFKRTGVSNDSTMVNVYLYNAGTRITDSAGVSASAFTFSDPTAIFTVGAGQTYTVSVRSDILTGTSGQQIGVQLVSATSNGTLDASVSFPINSGYQTISAANLATVIFAANPTPAGGQISPANDYPVWQDTVTVSTNPVKLTSMKFMNLGSANSSDITNLRLMVDGVQVGSAVTAMSADRSVTFDLTAAPFAMSTQQHVVKVLANIGTGAASRSIQFSVQRSSDGMFVDSQLNQPVTPTYSNTVSWASASTGTLTLSSASVSGVSVSRNPSSPSTNIAAGASAQKWASFDILASGENVKVSDLYVQAVTSIHKGGLNNGMIKVNGVQMGSTKAIGESSTDFSLGSSLILPAGIVTTVDIYADAQTSTSTNLTSDTVLVSLVAATSNAQGVSSYTTTGVPKGGNVDGYSITVSSSVLTATKATGYGSQQFVQGSTNAKIGSFVLGAGATEGVTVNTISITLPTVSSTLTNLTIKDSATGTTLGSVIPAPQLGSNSFYVSLDIPASSNKTIDIYANIMSGASMGSILATVDTGTSGSGDVTHLLTSVGANVPLQTISFNTGTFTVAKGAGDPASSIVLAGSSSVKVGQFKFSGANSSYTVNNLAILVPNNAATAVTSVNLSYKDVNGAVKTASATLTVDATKAYATATFTGLGMYVPTNSSANLDVFVGTPTIAAGGINNISGAAINVTLDSATGTFSKSDSAGTVSTGFAANIASAGTFYVRESVPTLSAVALSSTLTTGSGFAIGRVKVTADAAGDISWKKIVFSVSKTAAIQLGATSSLAVYKGSTLVGGTFATTTIPGNIPDADMFGAATSGSIVFIPTNEEQIAAGGSATYELRANVTGISSTGYYYVNVTVANPSNSNTTGTFSAVSSGTSSAPSFVWSDMSASSHGVGSSDWTNDYLLTGLPLTLANSSVSI